MKRLRWSGCWAREELLDAVYRVTWRTGEEMPVESARMIGQSVVIQKSRDPRVEWLTVDEWRGHATGWKRLGTIVRNAAGEYEFRRVTTPTMNLARPGSR